MAPSQANPAVSGLICRIYDGVLSADAWPGILGEVAEVTDFQVVNLFVSDQRHPEVQVTAASSGIEDRFIEQYRLRYADLDRPLVEKLLTYPAQVLVDDTELSGGPVDTDLARWLVEAVSVHKRVSVRLNDHRAWADGITWNLGARHRKGMTALQRQLVFQLLPHFAKAVEVSRPFNVLKARFKAVIAVLDRFHLGVLILNDHGQVVITNHEATRLLKEKDGLSLHPSGKPVAAGFAAGDGAPLGLAIEEALATSRGQASVPERLLTINRPSGRDALIVEVSPLSGRDSELPNGFRGALLLVIDPTRSEAVSTSGMEQLYGLTPAEAAVLGLVIDGRATSEIADARDTSPETVRSQIKALFSKTRTQTRSALVRLALTVNLPIDPERRADAPASRAPRA